MQNVSYLVRFLRWSAHFRQKNEQSTRRSLARVVIWGSLRVGLRSGLGLGLEPGLGLGWVVVWRNKKCRKYVKPPKKAKTIVYVYTRYVAFPRNAGCVEAFETRTIVEGLTDEQA